MHTSKKGFIVILSCCIIIVISYTYYKKQHTLTPPVPVMAYPSSSVKKESSTIILSVGETKETQGVAITLESITQDSRCPQDVQCIQKGTVDAKIILSFPLETKATEISLDKPLHFGDHTVTITDVTPAKNSQKEIKPNDYKVTFLVVKVLDEEKK